MAFQSKDPVLDCATSAAERNFRHEPERELHEAPFLVHANMRFISSLDFARDFGARLARRADASTSTVTIIRKRMIVFAQDGKIGKDTPFALVL